MPAQPPSSREKSPTSAPSNSAPPADVFRFTARMESTVLVAYLRWLADEIRRGEISIQDGSETERWKLPEKLRVNVRATRFPGGERLRIKIPWEETEREPFEIIPG